MNIGKKELIIIGSLIILYFSICYFLFPTKKTITIPIPKKNKKKSKNNEINIDDRTIYLEEEENNYDNYNDEFMDENRALQDPSRMIDDDIEQYGPDYNGMEERYGVKFALPYENNVENNMVEPSGVSSEGFDAHDGTIQDGNLKEDNILIGGLNPNNNNGYVKQDDDNQSFRPMSI